MNNLCYIIDNVFLPVKHYEGLSPNNLSEFRNVTQRFSKVMHNTISQLESEFTFDVMKLEGSLEENAKHPALLRQVEGQLENLTRKINDVLADIDNMKDVKISKPNDEIKYWKNKGAKLTKAHKLVTDERVRVLEKTLEYANDHAAEKRSSEVLDNYRKQLEELQREYIKIKEDENLVATLERHFNQVDSASQKDRGLENLRDPIHNLITHLKLIWMNTKHFHKDIGRFKLIMDAVEKEVNLKVRNEVTARLKEVTESRFDLELLMAEVKAGVAAASTFKDHYKATKQDVKDENSEYSWDESPELFKETETTINRLQEMLDKFDIIELHNGLIDNELTQVIGDANFLKESKESTFEMFKLFKNYGDRLFAREREQEFQKMVQDFDIARAKLDEKINKTIHEQFNSVRSSIDKFKMLEKFKNINKVLKDNSSDNFTSVLDDYTKSELKNYTDLYTQYRDNPPVSTTIPYFARKLIWAKQLYNRGYAPFAYLAKNQDKLGIEKTQKNTIIEAFKKFRKLFYGEEGKGGYIGEVEKDWKDHGREVLKHLANKKIIYEVKPDNNLKDKGDLTNKRFEVEMIDDVLEFIKEAKYMDSLGIELSRNIQNLVLNEYRYYEEINGLKYMLNEYNEIQRSFNNFEKRTIMSEYLRDLGRTIEEGTQKDWKSINKKTYIDRCTGEINRINKTRLAILKELTTINTSIIYIHKLDLVKLETHKPSMQDFLLEQTEELKAHNVTLASQMEAIKAACNIIEFTIKNYTQSVAKPDKDSKAGSKAFDSLRMFKFYVEIRILNALIKCIAKGLNTLAVMFCMTERVLRLHGFDEKLPWLFKISVQTIIPDVTLDPMPKDVQDNMKSLVAQVYDISKYMSRFKDVVQSEEKNVKAMAASQFELFKEGDLAQYSDLEDFAHTFFGDTRNHKILNLLKTGIENNLTEENLIKIKQELTEKKETLKLTEVIELEDLKSSPEKYLTTSYIEKQMYRYKLIYDSYKELQETSNNLIRKEYYVVDLQDFNQEVMNKAQENLQRYGRQLMLKAKLEFDDFKSTCFEYEKEINEKASNINKLKLILERISQIRNESHRIQISMYHIRERVRTFFMYLDYKYLIYTAADRELVSLMLEVKTIYKRWGDIVDLTYQKQEAMQKENREFADETRNKDQDFQLKVEDFNAQFQDKGPQCKVEIYEGLERYEDFTIRIKILKEMKDSIVKDQKLFDLPISKYEKLAAVDEKLNHIKPIFEIFGSYKRKMDEFKSKNWKELVTKDLRALAEEMPKKIRKELRGRSYENEFQMHNLNAITEELRKTTELIECLKVEGVKEIHFKEISEEVGVSINTDLKTMTVEDVLKLKLTQYDEFIREIADKAKVQETLEKDIQRIESTWKEYTMNIVKKERDGKSVYLLSGTEDIRTKLEEDQYMISTMGTDRGLLDNPELKSKLDKIEGQLNDVTETVDQWSLVQTKYMNLEIIFKNDEIKTQLKSETKEFNKLDKDYTKIAENAYNNKMILGICNKNTFNQLVDILKGLENCQRNLSKYLDDKKTKCPRFYFVSNDDLLCILGSQDPKVVQDFCSSKLFDNCKKLIFSATTQIEGMISEEEEYFKYFENVKPEGKVENWLNRVESEMVKSLKKLCKEGVYWYSKVKRLEWLSQHLGMVVIAAETVWWSWRVEDTFHKIKAGNKKGMKLEFQKQYQELEDLTDLLINTNDKKLRLKLNIMITCSVHSRDIVGDFVRDSILDTKEFQWESQLRFYFDNDTDIIHINQCTWVYQYCYEYQGLKDRLVITPLTDRCIMTLTTAMKFFLGGAPAGPAGTGKTESVKDLAKNLAVRCVVTNCGETMTKSNLANIYGGLASAGFWGCFDEFNRINEEVLSVAATQIAEIQDALKKRKDVINFDGMRVTMRETVALFITMNPTYLGRTELPDNLKALFRPMTMIVPDIDLICEIKLMSEGFKDARGLASKMAKLYKLCDEKLSKQMHYDFGLRTLKAALVMAGELKRDDGKRNEFNIIMKALRDMNTPRFTYEDQELFFSLIEGLFANVDITRSDFPPIKDTIIKILEKEDRRNLELYEAESVHQVNKTIHMYETMYTRHTTMVVGPTCAGKTTIIETLKSAKSDDSIGTKTRIWRINPKDRPVIELYGLANADTGDWIDGLLSKIYRQCNDNRIKIKDEEKWILFDGDIDAKWIEDMNSVMDDSKLLTLSGSDRIMLLPHCKLILEVDDLAYSSKATISRCGVVYMDNALLGYKPMYYRWCKLGFIEGMDAEKRPDKVREKLESFTDQFIEPLVKYLKEGLDDKEKKGALQEVQSKTELNLVRQTCNLMDIMMTETKYLENMEDELLQKIFVFSVVWGMGGSLEFSERKKFNEKFKNLLENEEISIANTAKSYFDIYLDTRGQDVEFKKWASLKTPYKPPENGEFSKILVPTEETAKYQYLMRLHVLKGLPICVIGESGVSKTVVTKNYLKSLNIEENTILNVNFSSSTKSIDMYQYLMECLEKDIGKNMKPKGGKILVVYIDDMSMPKKDDYNTQQVIAFMKFLFEFKYCWERRGGLDQIILNPKKIKYVMNMLPPGGGRNSLDPRFMTQINSYVMYESMEETKMYIYYQILKGHIDKYWSGNKKLEIMTKEMAAMTVRTFDEIGKKLSRTPIKFHYIFNLRDINKVYEGIMQSTLDKFETTKDFVRLWRHEMHKVVFDRLMTNEDRAQFANEIIPDALKKDFSDSADHAMSNPILYGDFLTLDPGVDMIDQWRLYEDCTDYENIKPQWVKILDVYNEENPPMELVMFDQALYHIVTISRVFRLPRGNALMIGVGGSGKTSTCKLSAFSSGMKLFTLTLSRNYNLDSMLENFRELYDNVVVKPKVFMFNDSHVIMENFIEVINTVITNAMVYGIYNDGEKEELMRPLRQDMKRDGVQHSEEWNYYLNKLKDNLHLCLCFSPAGDLLRNRCRNFPGIIANSNIDWFFEWPEEALIDVANFKLSDFNLDEEMKPDVIKFFAVVHISVGDYSASYIRKLKRVNYTTPKHFLNLIMQYTKTLENLRRIYEENIKKYKNGVWKIKESEDIVKVKKEELNIEMIELEKEHEKVNTLIKEIEESKIKTEETTIQTQTLNIQIAKKVEEVQAKQEKANIVMKESERVKQEIEKEVNENLDEKKIKGLQGYINNPPQKIKYIVQAVNCLNPTGQIFGNSWDGCKQLVMKSSAFYKGINEFMWDSGAGQKLKAKNLSEAEVWLKQLYKDCEREYGITSVAELGPTVKEKVSQDIFTLYQWVTMMRDWFESKKKYDEQVVLLDRATKELTEARSQKSELEERLERLLAEMNRMETELKEKKAKLQELEESLTIKKANLEIAEKLVSGLGEEKISWNREKDQLNIMYEKLVGDALLSCAFLTYLGPFESTFRRDIIASWMESIRKTNIPYDHEYKVSNFLASEVEKTTWESEGLSADTQSTENGILTLKSTRYPLCIDPQMQALNWVKKSFEQNNIKIKSMNDDYNKWLEISIKQGTPFLFENVTEEIDPMLVPLLEQNFQLKANSVIVNLNGQELELNENFRLYLMTKVANPKYTPEIFASAVIINYSVTPDGLKEQLLNRIVDFENSDLERRRKENVEIMSKNKREKKELEDELLKELSKEGDLLQNTELVRKLEESKTKSTLINQILKEAKESKEKIDKERMSYELGAIRGQVLYFALDVLSEIEYMYNYSLSYYLKLFDKALRTSKPDRNSKTNRLKYIINTNTTIVYFYGCLGLFEKHKLMFSFHLTSRILLNQKKIDLGLFNFLLRGNTSLEPPKQQKTISWMSDQNWKDIELLQSLDKKFGTFIDDLQQNEALWRAWYDEPCPEDAEMPNGYSSNDILSRICVLKVFRVDRLKEGISQWIVDKMGPEYIKPKYPNINEIYSMSDNKTPILYVLSPGADPRADIISKKEELEINLFEESLGQGSEDKAEDAIKTAIVKGTWVFLQNCHLLKKWLPTLDRLLDSDPVRRAHKDFRLWLTTKPTDYFPLGILHKSNKIVIEPPDGLDANLRSTWSKLNPRDFDSCINTEFKPLVYTVSFFHAVIQERKKFGKIGWNIAYDFNESDFSISIKLLNYYLGKSLEDNDEQRPWGSLKYLIGEAMYGGRVTDNWDRRILNTYLDEYLGDFVFDKREPFYLYVNKQHTVKYEIPFGEESMSGFQEYIYNTIPTKNPPTVFGLNINAEIIYNANFSNNILMTMLMTQSSSDETTDIVNKDDSVKVSVHDINAKLQNPYEEDKVKDQIDNSVDDPKDPRFYFTAVVLKQEIERVNKLLICIKRNLKDLNDVINGIIGMSTNLEVIYNDIFNGFIPETWKYLSPQTNKKLASWMVHLRKRIEQYNEWIKCEPNVTWLSGIHVPYSYMVALSQQFCKQNTLELDKLTIDTKVTNYTDASKVPSKPKNGRYISGMYIEGARFDVEKQVIKKQQPKVLIYDMPILHVEPVLISKLKTRDRYMCPTYVTSSRTNSSGDGFVYNAYLPTRKHESHWILQGVAMVLNDND